MLTHLERIKLLVALILTSETLLAGAAFAQAPATRDNQRKEADAAQGSRLGNSEAAASDPKPGRPENNVRTERPGPNDLKSEVETLKTENAAVRELLRKMEEQQKALLGQVDRLQRRLDGGATADVQPTGQSQEPLQTTEAAALVKNAAYAPVQPTDAGTAPAQQASDGKPEKEDRYQDGIIIYQNSDDAKVPFLLKFNNNTQIRYLNTLSSNDTFTDHLGVERDVHRRNDITVNRSMFIFGGYMFNKNPQTLRSRRLARRRNCRLKCYRDSIGRYLKNGLRVTW